MAFCRDLLAKSIEEREGKAATYDPASPPRLLKVRLRVHRSALYGSYDQHHTHGPLSLYSPVPRK